MFQTPDSSFRCAAVYKTFEDCPVTTKYINVIYIVQKFVTRVLLFHRSVSLHIRVPLSKFSAFSSTDSWSVLGARVLPAATQRLSLCVSDAAVSHS